VIFQTRLGAHTLFAIEDGWFYREPRELLPGSDPDIWTPELLVDGRLRVSAGCFLLAGPAGLIMIDSGFGVGAEPYSPDGGVGRLPECLSKLHVDPADVTAVLHTHMHPDHIGGDRDPEGKAFFPNARLYVHAREIEYWTSDERIGSPSQVEFQPLLDAGHVEPLEGDTEVLPGITMLETFGHTPGHMSVHIASDDTNAFITGDVTHHPVQVPHPEWGIPADVDSRQAIETRERVFDDLANSESLVAAGHYPRPGLGRIVADTDTRSFVSARATEIS
jgi:glyoxylase-like metal-dependent hydrolase (beta-lactamase superfamily II)